MIEVLSRKKADILNVYLDEKLDFKKIKLILKSKKLFLGLKKKTTLKRNELLRRLGSFFFNLDIGVEKFFIDFDENDLFYFLEGFILSSYKFRKDNESKREKKIFISKNSKKVLDKVRKLTNSVFLARDLINKDASTLNPDEFIRIIEEQLGYEYELEIYQGEKLRDLGMNLLFSVGKAAKSKPALVIARKTDNIDVALIGKGITYDSGGLCIKSCGSMFYMFTDMAGAATVLGVADYFKDKEHNFLFAFPLAENIVDADSYKPSDVIKAYNGKEVEIISTDAEGRLILADALSYVEEQYGPRNIIDIATLTGAISRAFGEDMAAVFSTDSKLVKQLIMAGEETGEYLWQMPVFEEYKRFLKTKRADLKNSGAPYAAGIFAALFLNEFIKTKKWAHIDIAGTAIRTKTRDYFTSVATGFGVRMLIKFLENYY